jgi:hypothetical protein
MQWPCWSVRWADEFLNAAVSPLGGPDAAENADTEPIPRA